MNLVKISLLSLLVTFSATAAEQTSNSTTEALPSGFISDDLFIYKHSGPGNNYRILGSINAGSEIKVTGQAKNDYTQIIDTKGQTVWVESKYVSNQPGLRNVIAELNTRLASNDESIGILERQVSESRERSSSVQNENTSLKNQLAELTNELAKTKAELKDQDMNVQKEWFFNGAIVLGIGLIFGLVLPRLGGGKKNRMDNWK